MNLDHIPKALRLIRDACGLTQAEAAEEIREKTGTKVTRGQNSSMGAWQWRAFPGVAIRVPEWARAKCP